MNIVIPLGGIGKRFKDKGFSKPKPFINALTKPIINWLLDSLSIPPNVVLIVLYNNELEKFNIESVLKGQYPHLSFIFKSLHEQTRGAAHTLFLAQKLIPQERLHLPFVSIDGDTFYTQDVLSLITENCIVTTNDVTEYEVPPYSYVKVNEKGIILEIKEKIKISDNAVTGIYSFASAILFRKYWDEFYNTVSSNEEIYTSRYISFLINHGIHFSHIPITSNFVHNLGTPLHLQIFCNNFPVKAISNFSTVTPISPKRICFDLDNTLVTFPTIHGDYSTCSPIQKNINLLCHLKKLGHTIIIYTARRMKTHNGNCGKLLADIGIITFQTLEDFEIPYDEIYFGKPYADFYIDDLAINAFTDLEKELGCYTSIASRHFNTCEISSFHVITKSSESSLAGEIHFYEHIPPSIKDMFPVFFGNNGNSYQIEYIEGVTASKVFTSDDKFTYSVLPEIFKSLERIHTSTSCTLPIHEIKKLYLPKLLSRYNQNLEIYKHIPHAQYCFDILHKYFSSSFDVYPCVMHGDPVFTNVIINSFGKFKFIDMRGSIDSNPTIFGDKCYDYAKIYQSIIGYDFILQGLPLNSAIINESKTIFENYINNNDMFKHIKYITAFLLFTLLPLHQDLHKCLKYISLCNELLDYI